MKLARPLFVCLVLVTWLARPGAAAEPPISKAHLSGLIAPHAFGGELSSGWVFKDVDTLSEKDAVFYLEKPERKRLFIWLTRRNDDVWSMARSKRFNMIAVAENSEGITDEQKNIAQKVFGLIEKNDTGGPQLKKQDTARGGLTVQLHNEENPEGDERGDPFRFPWKILFLVVLLAAGALAFHMLARKPEEQDSPPQE